MTKYRIRLERLEERYDEETYESTGEWDVVNAWGFKFDYDVRNGVENVLIRLSNTLAVDNGLVLKREDG